MLVGKKLAPIPKESLWEEMEVSEDTVWTYMKEPAGRGGEVLTESAGRGRNRKRNAGHMSKKERREVRTEDSSTRDCKEFGARRVRKAKQNTVQSIEGPNSAQNNPTRV